MTETKYQLIPVLEQHIPAVIELLAQLNAAGAAGPAAETETIDVPENGTWSFAELVEMHTRCNDRTRTILARIAAASLTDTEASYNDLLEAGRPYAGDPANYGFNNLRADLAWIAKYAKKIKGTNVWPLTYRQIGPEHPKGERYLYKMPVGIAKWWTEIGG